LKKGFITKIISNQYTLIDLETKKSHIAVARGKLRYQVVDEESSFNIKQTKRSKLEQKIMTITPKVGDYVNFDFVEDQVIIFDILPRKNDLVRPDVSNIDQVLLVFSAVDPAFSFHLLDRLLVVINQQEIPALLVVSKIDLIEEEQLKQLKEDLKYYEKIIENIVYVNSKQKIGVDVLFDVFKDKVSVLAGQTGVGKSTLVNALIPGLELKTQAISKALGRGKHTTRHTELYPFRDGYLVDTPGFSKIDFLLFHEDELKQFFPDFAQLSESCRFGYSCLHENEPNCAVKKAVQNKEILPSRYENYIIFLTEIKNQKERY